MAEQNQETLRYSVFLLVVGLQLFAAFFGTVAESMLEGLQLYYVKNNVTMINSVVGAVITFFFIEKFDALIFLALLNGIGTTSKFVTFFILLKRARGDSLRAPPDTVLWHSSKSRWYSAPSLRPGPGGISGVDSPTLIIGGILGPAIVVFYSLPAALAKQLRTLIWTLTHAFMPLFSDLHTRGRNDQLPFIYVTASRLVVGLVAPGSGPRRDPRS